MKDIPITDAREDLTSLPEQLTRTHETVMVTRRGKPVLAILPWEEYEAIVETLDILSDPALVASLRRGITEVRQGKTISWEQAKRKLRL